MFASLFTLLWHHRHIMWSLQSAFMKKWKWKRQISQYYYKNIITSGAPWNGCPKLHCLNIYLHITDFFHFLKETWNLNFCNSQGSCFIFKRNIYWAVLFPRYFHMFSFKSSGGTIGKEPTCQCRRCKKCRFDPWVGKIPWRRAWQPTLVFLPGKIPWTEEPSGLQSMGLQRVGHDWSDWAHTHTHYGK